MSSDRDVTRIVRSWMDEGATQLPDRVLDAVLDQLPATPQRRPSWTARRTPVMSTYLKVGFAAAAVVIAAFIGLQLLGQTTPGGPGPTHSPSPSPEESPAASSNIVGFTTYPEGTDLQAGPYLMDYAEELDVVLTVPAADAQGSRSAWYKADFDWGPWHVSNAARLEIAHIANVYVDPCDASPTLRDPAVGPTVHNLESALESVPGLVVSGSSVESLHGYSGRLLEVTGGERRADCVADPLVWVTTQGDPAFLLPTTGDRVRVWILNLTGSPSPDAVGPRLVIWASEDNGFDAPEDMEQLISLIRLYRPGSVP
jgi:hypothetical protein